MSLDRGGSSLPLAGGAGGAEVTGGVAPGRLTLNPRTGPPMPGDGLSGVIVVLLRTGPTLSCPPDLDDIPWPEVSSRALVGTLRVVLERSSTADRGASSIRSQQ